MCTRMSIRFTNYWIIFTTCLQSSCAWSCLTSLFVTVFVFSLFYKLKTLIIQYEFITLRSGEVHFTCCLLLYFDVCFWTMIADTSFSLIKLDNYTDSLRAMINGERFFDTTYHGDDWRFVNSLSTSINYATIGRDRSEKGSGTITFQCSIIRSVITGQCCMKDRFMFIYRHHSRCCSIIDVSWSSPKRVVSFVRLLEQDGFMNEPYQLHILHDTEFTRSPLRAVSQSIRWLYDRYQ